MNKEDIMISKEITIKIKTGLEVGPVAELIQVASQFKSVVYVIYDNKQVNAKSLMGMMTLSTLGLDAGKNVKVTAEGEDEEEAIKAVEKYLITEK
jgi:catabolite repression HPr-like protein